jgi:hypothetical protein
MRLSGGYIFSGYLIRLCPFLVYHSDVLTALGVFASIAVAIALIERTTLLNFNRTPAVLASTFAIIIVMNWAYIQYSTMRWLPPTQFGFTKFLRRNTDSNIGLVTNNYQPPFSLMSGTWAYLDVEFSYDLITETVRRPRNPYLFLSDGRTNSRYDNPGLFVCFMGPSSLASAAFAKDRGTCSSLPIVKQAISGSASNDVHANVILRDMQDDRWAILKLDWAQP